MTILNNAEINTGMQTSHQDTDFPCFGYIASNEIASHMLLLFLLV
jgi:hypothetical protein